ncbi:PstS family phosphate ABC transporter substrate-binding protein [Salinilacihabitans rarus]|uniref:PstS family phosphate ABC transporter substrate-binding protein n=1 Tax=Salinilacihabitans rarus TaxID=2961596 RepID=UPI0020C8FB12|nr:PstS family phosphate ABC transporter substrate-binding protein [Salinilacihabitans rarus]
MPDKQIGRRVDAVSRRKLLAATGSIGALAVAGCSENEASDGGDGGSDALSGEVVVTGSSTVFPISDRMAEEFMAEHDVNVPVDSTGSGGGFENHFCPGDSDINGASRPIKDAEVASCGDQGVTPVEFHVAGDALTMAVSPENDWVDCMTFDEMAQIWQEDGAETWADVDPDWPDEEFELFGPDTTSGTFDWFTENVVGEAGNHRDDYEPTEDDNIIIQGLEQNPYAIGYFGYAYYAENQDRVKALEVRETADDECGEPSLQAASDGTYPMARPLFIYASEDAIQREEVAAFLEFYLENASADFVADEIGYVPSSDKMVEENLATLEEYA